MSLTTEQPGGYHPRVPSRRGLVIFLALTLAGPGRALAGGLDEFREAVGSALQNLQSDPDYKYLALEDVASRGPGLEGSRVAVAGMANWIEFGRKPPHFALCTGWGIGLSLGVDAGALGAEMRQELIDGHFPPTVYLVRGVLRRGALGGIPLEVPGYHLELEAVLNLGREPHNGLMSFTDNLKAADLTALTVPAPVPARPYGLLQKSAILAKADASVFPAGADAEGNSLLTEREYPQYPALLLGADGAVRKLRHPQGLNGMLGWGCGGEDVPALGYKAEGGGKPSGGLAILGRDLDGIAVTWEPAAAMSSATIPSCVAYKADHRLLAYFPSRLPKTGGFYYYAAWDTPGPDTGAEDDCVERVGYTDAKGRCFTLHESTAKREDGCPPYGVGDRTGLGVLKLQKNGAREEWLLYNTPGYEGEGIGHVPFDPAGPKRVDPKSVDHYVYSGC